MAPRHVGSSRTRDRTCVPCVGRRVLNHCTTREVPFSRYLVIVSPVLKDGSLIFSSQLPLHLCAPLYSRPPQKGCPLTALLKVINDLHVATPNSHSQSSSASFGTFNLSLFLEIYSLISRTSIVLFSSDLVGAPSPRPPAHNIGVLRTHPLHGCSSSSA